MAAPSKTPVGTVPISRVGLIAMLVGVALAMLGPALFDGFIKGLFVGAGVALVVLGVFVVSARWRARPDGSWLPSRDE